MKKIFLLLIVSIVFIACNKSKPIDKKAELENLKKEQSKIAAKIKAIEEQLAKENPDSNRKLRFVALDTLKNKNFEHLIEIQGKIEADQNVMLSARSAGVVTAVLVNTGDVVKKGQVLAKLDDIIIRKSMDELKSRLDFAITVYNKQKNLWDQKIGTEVQYLQAKSNKEALENSLATLNEQLDLTRIKSPITGTVDEVNIKLGQTLAPGQPAIRVINSSQLKAVAKVGETHLSNVKTGNTVKITFPDLKKALETKISFASKAIDPVTRTFDVEVQLQSGDKQYRPNMLAIMKIVDYQVKDVISIPVNVIQHDQGGEYVYVAENQNGKLVVKKKLITVGMISEGFAEIKSGLSPNELLITNGYQDLSEGDLVQL